jgi:hypothetical protein
LPPSPKATGIKTQNKRAQNPHGSSKDLYAKDLRNFLATKPKGHRDKNTKEKSPKPSQQNPCPRKPSDLKTLACK